VLPNKQLKAAVETSPEMAAYRAKNRRRDARHKALTKFRRAMAGERVHAIHVYSDGRAQA
jgi:hypothetical protein